MIDNELLLAISDMMDKKLTPIENRIKHIEVDLLEDKVLPRLNTIESCYTSTFDRYKDSVRVRSYKTRHIYHEKSNPRTQHKATKHVLTNTTTKEI